MCAHVCVCLRLCICVCVHVSVFMCLCSCVCVHVSVFMCLCSCVCAHMSVFMCMIYAGVTYINLIVFAASSPWASASLIWCRERRTHSMGHFSPSYSLTYIVRRAASSMFHFFLSILISYDTHTNPQTHKHPSPTDASNPSILYSDEDSNDVLRSYHYEGIIWANDRPWSIDIYATDE